MRLVVATLLVAFISNYIWEHAHASMYFHPLGEKMTEWMLFRATLGDVFILGVFALLWYSVPVLKRRIWFVVPLGLVVAYAIEEYALYTSRWAYTEAMPVVPYLEVGLSPLLQLACTALLLLYILKYVDR